MTIRAGSAADLEFVRRVAVAVFSDFGDYGRIIPDWLANDGVLTYVAEEEAVPVGFIMLGFYRVEGESYAADLLAIAVAPEAQSRGVGRRLLDHALATARATRRRLPVREVRLSVADTNARARRMFAAAGFVELDGEHGRYDGGQRALHMMKRL
jgi:ribosomal protein S18 acetylase RimI-like enzyme